MDYAGPVIVVSMLMGIVLVFVGAALDSSVIQLIAAACFIPFVVALGLMLFGATVSGLDTVVPVFHGKTFVIGIVAVALTLLLAILVFSGSTERGDCVIYKGERLC